MYAFIHTYVFSLCVYLNTYSIDIFVHMYIYIHRTPDPNRDSLNPGSPNPSSPKSPCSPRQPKHGKKSTLEQSIIDDFFTKDLNSFNSIRNLGQHSRGNSTSMDELRGTYLHMYICVYIYFALFICHLYGHIHVYIF